MSGGAERRAARSAFRSVPHHPSSATKRHPDVADWNQSLAETSRENSPLEISSRHTFAWLSDWGHSRRRDRRSTAIRRIYRALAMETGSSLSLSLSLFPSPFLFLFAKSLSLQSRTNTGLLRSRPLRPERFESIHRGFQRSPLCFLGFPFQHSLAAL